MHHHHAITFIISFSPAYYTILNGTTQNSSRRSHYRHFELLSPFALVPLVPAYANNFSTYTAAGQLRGPFTKASRMIGGHTLKNDAS